MKNTCFFNKFISTTPCKIILYIKFSIIFLLNQLIYDNCNFFEKIKYLKIGDEIIYTTTNGKKVYKVQTNKVIKDTDWSYLGATKDNRITLITCEENREEYRRCIQALEVASYKI